MSDQHSTNVGLLLLLGKLRDEALTAEDAARLDELLQGSDEAKSLFVQYMSIASLLESRGVGERETQDDDTPVTINHDVLAELLELEREAQTIELPTQAFEPKPKVMKTDALTWREVTSAAAYLLNKPKMWGSLAALLALAVTLVIVLGPSTTPAPIANTVGQDSTPQVNPITPVATLTATHNAKWAERALARGSALQAGQTLTLTAGFAEITTNDGAIAILEAPATIELLNNNNALRLHSGKLVGICETESSKGFLVRTPHMDITDLGTRFGVDTSMGRGTEVHVVEGSVQVEDPARLDTQPRTLQLAKGQAIRVDPS
ncbi:MAG: FecR domain-containing protein, partial [Phycisphaeraceae bacterium]